MSAIYNKQRLRHWATYMTDIRLSHYLLVGGFSALVDIGLVYVLFQLVHTPLLVAASVGFLIGLLVNFMLNKLWSFRTKAVGFKKTQREIALYGLLVGFNLSFTYMALSYLLAIEVNIIVAKFITILLTTTWNFILYKKVIFK